MAAHREAVEKAGILHRDISAGNLLICEYKSKDANGSPERRGTPDRKPVLVTDYDQGVQRNKGMNVRSGE